MYRMILFDQSSLELAGRFLAPHDSFLLSLHDL